MGSWLRCSVARGLLLCLLIAVALPTIIAASGEPPSDPCMSHLSCQTCLHDDGCVWCSLGQVCATANVLAPTNTCTGAIQECACTHNKNCSTCLAAGYCGWCDDAHTCYSQGDRPNNCLDFHEQICGERNSFGAEYALLVIILSVTVVGGVIVTIIFIYKWWQTRRLLRESTDSPRMSDRDYIDHLQSDSDNMYFVDDDDGLISGKKKKRTTESIGIGRKIMNKTDELLGTTPAM